MLIPKVDDDKPLCVFFNVVCITNLYLKNGNFKDFQDYNPNISRLQVPQIGYNPTY